jgi:hypothetical protein
VWIVARPHCMIVFLMFVLVVVFLVSCVLTSVSALV